MNTNPHISKYEARNDRNLLGNIVVFTYLLLTFSIIPGCENGGKTLDSNGSHQDASVEKSMQPNDQLRQLNSSVKSYPGMVFVPAGTFNMGSNQKDVGEVKKQEYGLVNPLYVDENPEHKVQLPAFHIDKYEVSNVQYKQFVLSAKHKEPMPWTQNGYNLILKRLQRTSLDNLRWIASEYFKLDVDTNAMNEKQLIVAMQQDWLNKDKLPVTSVDWYDAVAYCQWKEKRLPTEQEWERAAKGQNNYRYPWGNEWRAEYTNSGDSDGWENGIAPTGIFPKNKSEFGVYDLSGNVWEWVASWYKPYPGSEYQHEAFGETHRVIRGGGGGLGHYALSVFFRNAARSYALPNNKSDDVGFRCAKD